MASWSDGGQIFPHISVAKACGSPCWGEELPENLKVKWEKWVSELPQLSNVAIPRCLRRAYPENIELHLFSDASNEAFASVAYLVCR